MTRSFKKFLQANNFPYVTFKNYWRHSSRSELIIDVFLPFIISVLTIWWISYYVFEFKILIEKFQQLSGQIITAISILAGFNITSITVISAAGDNVQKLKGMLSSDGGTTVYNIMIIFFTWAVTIQLIVVFVSILLFYLGSFIPAALRSPIPIWGWVFAVMWLSITFHSILISLRNLKTLFLYVTHNPEAKKSH